MKIFLSAVSAQFKACRDALASDLRAIGCEVRVQEDFQQGPRTLIERLEEYVAQCDRVIALVGDAYGYEAAGDAVPTTDPPRSYTQWEYFFATGERLKGPKAEPKDLYVYFASDQFLSANPVPQSDEEKRRQVSFVKRIKDSGKHWAPSTASTSSAAACCATAGRWRTARPCPTAEPEPPALVALREALTADSAAAVPDLDEEALQAILRHQPRTLGAYRVARVAEWSQPRYALDKRFTRLTLLLDQGPDAQGARWQPQPRTFQDLREVLEEVREPAVVAARTARLRQEHPAAPPGAGPGPRRPARSAPMTRR